MRDWLWQEIPILFEQWFQVVMLIILAVEIAVKLPWMPSGAILCPWWYAAC